MKLLTQSIDRVIYVDFYGGSIDCRQESRESRDFSNFHKIHFILTIESHCVIFIFCSKRERERGGLVVVVLVVADTFFWLLCEIIWCLVCYSHIFSYDARAFLLIFKRLSKIMKHMKINQS